MCRRQIAEAFAKYPDHDIFGSLPDAKQKLGPQLLSQIGAAQEVFHDADSLMCLAGVSPVSPQTGQIRKAHIRYPFKYSEPT